MESERSVKMELVDSWSDGKAVRHGSKLLFLKLSVIVSTENGNIVREDFTMMQKV